jgi:hypothetical protein
MTGVVTAAFNQQVNDAALAQQQAKTSALEQNLATLPAVCAEQAHHRPETRRKGR